MSNFWIDTTTIACASVLGFLSIVDSITKASYKNSNKNWKWLLDSLKKLKVKLPIFLTTCAIGLFVNKLKYNNIKRDSDIAKAEYEQGLNKRDSVNQIRFNESLVKASGAASAANAETMAKYYLKYDSVQHIVERIVKDSSKKNVITQTYTDALPDLDISDIKLIKSRNDTLEFKINITCKKTAIKQLNLSCQLLLLKGRNFTFCPPIKRFMPKDLDLSSNTTYQIDYVNINSLKNILQAFFHIYGSYLYKNEKFPVDYILSYNFRENIYGFPDGKESLVKIFNQFP